jgi:hypothetical protein
MFRENILDIQDYESKELIHYTEKLRTRRPYFDSRQEVGAILSVPVIEVIYIFQDVHPRKQ